MLVVTTLMIGCAAPDGVQLVHPHPAYVQDYLYLAIQEIASRCPDLGEQLMEKYTSGALTFADVQSTYDDIAHADIAGEDGYTADNTHIYLDTDYYDSQGSGTEVEYLVYDIVHEAGHAIGGYDDQKDSNGNYVYQVDAMGRSGHVNPYDSDLASGDCPS